MMNRGELIQRLNEIEDRSAPYDILIDGAPIWPVVRLAVGNQQLEGLTTPRRPPSPSTIPEKVLKLAIGSFQDLFSAYRGPDRPVLFFSSPVYRSVEGAQTLDKFAHPLIEASAFLGKSTVLFAKGSPPSPPFRSMKGSTTIWTDNLLEYHRRSHPPKDLPTLPALMKPLLEPVHVKFPDVDERSIVRKLKVFRAHLNAYRRILPRYAPQHVFVTCWYTEENMAIAQVCSEMGVPCTDLQHGVQGPAHLAYGRWGSLPASGCSTIPSSFWCWDKASARNIATWAPVTKHRPWVGGNPWLERTSGRKGAVSRTILFTLQPIHDPLPDDLARIIHQRPPDELWVFRTHPRSPGQGQEILDRARRSGIEEKIMVEDPKLRSLGDSMADSAVHVTYFSSCILEASYLGVPSIALSPEAAEIFPEQVADGSLMICTPLDELSSLLERVNRSTTAPAEFPPIQDRLSTFLSWEMAAPTGGR